MPCDLKEYTSLGQGTGGGYGGVSDQDPRLGCSGIMQRMSTTMVIANVFITLALVFYTIGVWAERFARYLKPWHVAMFWIGLACDTTGTYAMEQLSESTNWFSFHTITGLLAILLMLGHAIWATWTIRSGTEEAKRDFHKYSVVVWLFWLVPYIGGAVFGMM
jgi:uncharacterized repeat protein (TIGR03987 family)